MILIQRYKALPIIVQVGLFGGITGFILLTIAFFLILNNIIHSFLAIYFLLVFNGIFVGILTMIKGEKRSYWNNLESGAVASFVIAALSLTTLISAVLLGSLRDILRLGGVAYTQIDDYIWVLLEVLIMSPFLVFGLLWGVSLGSVLAVEGVSVLKGEKKRIIGVLVASFFILSLPMALGWLDSQEKPAQAIKDSTQNTSSIFETPRWKPVNLSLEDAQAISGLELPVPQYLPENSVFEGAYLAHPIEKRKDVPDSVNVVELWYSSPQGEFAVKVCGWSIRAGDKTSNFTLPSLKDQLPFGKRVNGRWAWIRKNVTVDSPLTSSSINMTWIKWEDRYHGMWEGWGHVETVKYCVFGEPSEAELLRISESVSR